ncbi:uncharacterized protein LOC127258467 [Andrographis paniculata]|uniref:uncharacterized protein LOC127258467 n=1 Tax=Andrographis paniculata TaxID=175694 RepID=UPI0021E7B003|nr:uncharacterized protein LOC127258467 [Andrographis paniculata]XP_051141272.1 uncharacterized protein LOC127258467 [Andrographis paniculata]
MHHCLDGQGRGGAGKTGMRNKHRRRTSWPCNAGLKCSMPLAIACLVGILLMLHLYTFTTQTNVISNEVDRVGKINRVLLRELEVVEEENIQMPPPRKRSPRAVKRKPKPTPTLIDEFLDDSSRIRHVFFPGIEMAVDPTKHDVGNDTFYYYPGRVWLDTEGRPIQAHGGGVLYDENSRTYYWYGEYKDGPTYHIHRNAPARVDVIGVGCYSSKDLWAWKNEGIVLTAEEKNETHDLHKSNVLERPKVIYNDKTGKYVMWMHVDDANYTKASVGVAISDSPTGPFRYLYSKRPHGFDSRDMTLFKDDDGAAYLIYSSNDNSDLHISPLDDDYVDTTNAVRRILIGQHREAPALFKHRGTYYMITSGCTGWAPNEAMAHATESIMGPWETMGNPCVGGNKMFQTTTFFAQSTFVLPAPGLPGLFVFMADRWNPADLRDSRYVWLPLMVGGAADKPLDYDFGFPLWSRVSIYWHKRWRIPTPGE